MLAEMPLDVEGDALSKKPAAWVTGYLTIGANAGKQPCRDRQSPLSTEPTPPRPAPNGIRYCVQAFLLPREGIECPASK